MQPEIDIFRSSEFPLPFGSIFRFQLFVFRGVFLAFFPGSVHIPCSESVLVNSQHQPVDLHLLQPTGSHGAFCLHCSQDSEELPPVLPQGSQRSRSSGSQSVLSLTLDPDTWSESLWGWRAGPASPSTHRGWWVDCGWLNGIYCQLSSL